MTKVTPTRYGKMRRRATARLARSRTNDSAARLLIGESMATTADAIHPG
jgi:hypothetical protein